MPGSKGLNPHEPAHKWVKDLGADCVSAKHGTIRMHHSWGLLPPTSCKYYTRKAANTVHICSFSFYENASGILVSVKVQASG